MSTIIKFFNNYLHISNTYIIYIILSIIAYIIIKIIETLIGKINQKFLKNEKQIYTVHKRYKTVLSIIYIVIILSIWKTEFKEFITLISFISAAVTLAAREIIYNYFCGIYIRITKPIKIEDRIKVADTIGDVINLNILSFEMLEVNPITNQSTGKIIHIPNSQIFNSTIENYNTAFKYIWDEISISINLNCDIEKSKKILNNIVNNNEIIKEIPKKMKSEIKKSNTDYRIYYNNLTPIIYTKIEDSKIVLTIRFLMHPKKQRNVESDIYEQILKQFKKNNIEIV